MAGQGERLKTEAVEVVRDVAGTKEWSRSKVGYLTGFGAIASAFRSAARYPASAVGRIIGMVGIFRRADVPALRTDSVDEAERFLVAQRSYGRSEHQIARQIMATHRSFTMYFVMVVGILALGIATFSSASGLGLLIEAVSHFALVPLLVALAARSGFWNWQLRTRRLGSFSAWVRDPSLWMSHGTEGSGDGRTLAAMGLLALAASVAMVSGISPAFAQTTVPGAGASSSTVVGAIVATPPSTDLWFQMLGYVFPGVGPFSGVQMPGNSGAAAVASAFSSFIAVLMGVASAFLAYELVVGVANTAHHGEILGRQFSELWAPIRIATGFGLLTPIVKGFCLAQILVIYLAVWGGNFGNVLWNAYLTTVAVPTFNAPPNPNSLPTVRDLMAMEVCVATMNRPDVGGSQTYLPLGDGGVAILPDVYPTTQTDWQARGAPVTTSNGASFLGAVAPYNLQKMVLDFGNCGTLSVQSQETASSDPVLTARQTYDTARKAAIRTLDAALIPIAKAIAAAAAPNASQSGAPMPSFDLVTAAKTAYDASMTSAASTLAATMNNLGNSTLGPSGTTVPLLKANGWPVAGAFYMVFSRIQGQLSGMTGEIPEIVAGNGSGLAINELRRPAGMHALEIYMSWWTTGATTNSAALAAAADTGDISQMSTADQIFSFVFSTSFLQTALNQIQINLSTGNALGVMVTFGHQILNLFFWAVTALVAIGAGSLAAGMMGMFSGAVAGGAAAGPAGAVAGSAGGFVASALAAKALAAIQSIVMSGVFMLLVVGLVHAYLLPMIPFVMMFFFIVGMLTLVVEGVIAAPLWAAAHITLSGGPEEFVTQVQKPGYMIMFNLFVRIPLALLGLFMSFAVFDVLAWFLSETYNSAFVAAISGHGAGLFGILFSMVLLGYLHYQAAMRSFGLINHVPDRVTRWFGQSGENLGEDRHSEGVAGAAVGIIERKAEAVQTGATAAGQIRRGGGVRGAAEGEGGNTTSTTPVRTQTPAVQPTNDSSVS